MNMIRANGKIVNERIRKGILNSPGIHFWPPLFLLFSPSSKGCTSIWQVSSPALWLSSFRCKKKLFSSLVHTLSQTHKHRALSLSLAVTLAPSRCVLCFWRRRRRSERRKFLEKKEKESFTLSSNNKQEEKKESTAAIQSKVYLHSAPSLSLNAEFCFLLHTPPQSLCIF